MTHLAQILLATAAGLSFATVIIVIARRGKLSMRYTLGWLFVAGCMVVGGLFSGLVEPLADALGVEPVAFVAVGAALALLALTVQLSITVSGLMEVVRTLAESYALLEERVRRYERPPSPSDSVRIELQELEDLGDEG